MQGAMQEDKAVDGGYISTAALTSLESVESS